LGPILDEFGVALGCGKFSTLQKGTLTQQRAVYGFLNDYMTSQLANCSKDVADKTRCTKVIADAKLLKAIGTDMAADDVYNKKTAAEQATWWTAYAKK